MGKILAVRVGPKEAKHKIVKRTLATDWNERHLIDWVKEVCVGQVWYDAIHIQPWLNKPEHYIVTLWFEKKKDAMYYKLAYT